MNNLYDRAVRLYEQGQLDDALIPLEELAALEPGRADLHAAIAEIHVRKRRLASAIEHYTEAVRIAPQWAETQCNFGAVLCDAGQLTEAEIRLRIALRIDPALMNARYNLGLVLTQLSRFEEAEQCYRHLLALHPNHARAHANLGLVRQYRGDIAGAVVSFRRALELNPALPEARQNLAYLRLVTNNFEDGWEKRRWIHRRIVRPQHFVEPAWNGEPLDGRTLLLHCDRDADNFVQFIRYAPLIGGRVLVRCAPRLCKLLASCEGIEIAGDEPFDVHCAVSDLAMFIEQIPANVPYLHADRARVEHWRRELPPDAIGIAWQGSPTQFEPLRAIAPLVSLQIGAAIGDLDETAAIISALDLVITGDTFIAHLAGALGRPVWVALCDTPDWPWPGRGDTTPWYPAMRLFRQQRAGEWPAVFAQIADALRRRR